MVKRRIIPLLGVVMLLAGCFRQANDSFDTVNSEDSQEQPIIIEETPATPTMEVIIIDPDATEEAESALESQDAEEPTATVRVIQPTAIDVEPTDVPPTATEAQTFITPQVEVQATIPTATATPVVTEAPLQPTPTAISGATGTCEYAVRSGDNLFRIAINNNVTLAALLAENGLSENSIIQPGQVLRIPNCGGADTDTSEEEPVTAPTQRPPSTCEYVIQPGDTLFDIAVAEGVRLADLLAENGLSENSIIQPGQVLTLPGCTPEAEETPTSEADGAEIPGDAETTDGNTITHQVVAGETLLSIARRYNVTVNDIIQANDIPDLNNLTVGMMLNIPQSDN